MKKLLMVLISCLLVLGMSGCDKTPKFNEDELLEKLEANSWFYDVNDQNMFVGFNKAEKTYEESLLNTSYYLKCEITKIEKTAENEYKMTMHVPAFEGNEETEGHEAYDIVYMITYDLNKPEEFYQTHIDSDGKTSEKKHFVSDKGLSEEELLKLLEDNSWYCDKQRNVYAGFKAAEKLYQETMPETSYFFEAKISDFKYIGVFTYSMKLHVDAFEGNEETEGHEAYDLMYYITIKPSLPTEYSSLKETENKDYSESGYFVSDKGLSMEELLKLLEANGKFLNKKEGLYQWYEASTKKFREMIYATSYQIEADIIDFEYLFNNTYALTARVPGFAGNEMDDPYDPYDIYLTIVYNRNTPKEYDASVYYSNYGNSMSGHFVQNNDH